MTIDTTATRHLEDRDIVTALRTLHDALLTADWGVVRECTTHIAALERRRLASR